MKVFSFDNKWYQGCCYNGFEYLFHSDRIHGVSVTCKECCVWNKSLAENFMQNMPTENRQCHVDTVKIFQTCALLDKANST